MRYYFTSDENGRPHVTTELNAAAVTDAEADLGLPYSEAEMLAHPDLAEALERWKAGETEGVATDLALSDLRILGEALQSYPIDDDRRANELIFDENPHLPAVELRHRIIAACRGFLEEIRAFPGVGDLETQVRRWEGPRPALEVQRMERHDQKQQAETAVGA